MPPKKMNRDGERAIPDPDQLDMDELKGMLQDSIDREAQLTARLQEQMDEKAELVGKMEEQKKEFEANTAAAAAAATVRPQHPGKPDIIDEEDDWNGTGASPRTEERRSLVNHDDDNDGDSVVNIPPNSRAGGKGKGKGHLSPGSRSPGTRSPGGRHSPAGGSPRNNRSGALSPESPILKLVAPSGMDIGSVHLNRAQTITMCVSGMLLVGFVCGFMVPPPSDDPYPYNVISSVVGWLYFAIWTFSFLPQIYLNYRRGSVAGQAFDFVYLNILGYGAYSVYNVCLFAVDSVRARYASIFHAHNNVAINDVFYAVFSCSMCIFNAWQIAVYDRGGQTGSTRVVGVCIATAVGFTLWALFIVAFPAAVEDSIALGPMGFLYGLSLVKGLVTLFKYLPQVTLNYRRRLTIGWNIWNVMLDFTGGCLSILQAVFDSSVTGNWSALYGNPIKLALGFIAIIYNSIFMAQHWVLYRRNNKAVIAAVIAYLAEEEEEFVVDEEGNAINDMFTTKPVVEDGARRAAAAPPLAPSAGAGATTAVSEEMRTNPTSAQAKTAR